VRAEDVERIHEASLRILDDVGVRLEHDAIVERTLAAGARPGDGPHDVRLPPAMVREHLALAPRKVELSARDGTTSVLHAESETVFWTAPVLYLWTGAARRPITSEDLATSRGSATGSTRCRRSWAWRWTTCRPGTATSSACG
jgi:trimethylamine:corrinoid methyltransferase-like protein